MSIEGAIKFNLQFTPSPPLPEKALREINAWRHILYLMQLIGRSPDRYGGFGYGNISQRLDSHDVPPHRRRFVISGTQTGGLAWLNPEHYAVVVECRPEQNLVVAEGPIPPSAESLTHGMLYALDDGLRFVIHAHSPHLWHAAPELGIPVTREEVAYGTPEMAEEVRRLFQETKVRELLIFAMGGHEDGVISFGHTAEEAGTVMIRYLVRALALRPSP
ncbi:MAG: class II aldolase/adducin family protein [Anaerolineae bacterium]|nr:class II aldolase/adducin family protein [Anaerolineae bacterium]